MKRKTSVRHAVLLSLVVLLPPASEAVVITDPVKAPPEQCTIGLAGHFQAPSRDLLDCKNDWCEVRCRELPSKCPSPCEDPNCGRLNPVLRAAARTWDARGLLVRAAWSFYLVRHPELEPPSQPPFPHHLYGRAFADLAVTGQAAYASFRALAPSEAVLTAPVQQRLAAFFPTHQPVPSDVSGAIRDALDRSYRVAWALRGPTPHRNAARGALGWIAVSGEDDPPHRPVNIPAAPFPQYNMSVQVSGINVTTRYMVASREIPDIHPVDLNAIPPDRDLPLIIGDVVLFIPGHSSSAEEALTLAYQLVAQAAPGRPVTLIAMDLPSNGYASMIDHEAISPSTASSWNTGYPILDFIERFVVAFVDGLEARQPGIKGQIVGVIGGSLGGNMGLRLGRRDPATYPWLRNVVSWSPASCWDSWVRGGGSTIGGPLNLQEGVVKVPSVNRTRQYMTDPETPESLHLLFHSRDFHVKTGRAEQAEHWYSASWPCKDAAITSGHRFVYETYNERFRRWHWRVAHEQLIFSHWDSDLPITEDQLIFVAPEYFKKAKIDPDPRNNPAAGPARYAQIRARLLFASGYNDNQWPEYLFENAKNLAGAMTMVNGAALFVADTAHSIHVERPSWFASRILEFLYESPPPPFPAFLVPATSF